MSHLKQFSFVASALLPVVSLSAKEKVERSPNIIVFLIDDMGWNDLGCYGSKFYQTPNMDRLAQSGALFTDAYAACTVSSPTRAALMTGKYPARLHVTDWIAGWNYPWAKLSVPEWTKYLPLEEKTIAEYLKEAGYQTWHVGKWHLGDDEKYWPENQGFDVNIGGNFKGAPIKNKKGCNGYFSPYGLPRLENGEEGEYLTDRLTDEAMRLIEKSGDTPFFLNMSHYAVHTPLGAKPEMEKKYEALVDSSYFQKNATYAAMIESVDQSLGDLLKVLDKKGVLDNTLIILTSDNGAVHSISRSYPLRKGKGAEYEGGVRVPFIVNWKGHTKAGQVVDTPVITMDIPATILNAAGIKTKGAVMDGISLLPSLSDSQRVSDIKKKRPLFWHYPHYHNGGARPYSAVRLGDWKLINQYETDTYELYNLKEDVGEEHDLQNQYPKKLSELRNILQNWLLSVDAQLPAKNPNWDQKRERKTGKYAGID